MLIIKVIHVFIFLVFVTPEAKKLKLEESLNIVKKSLDFLRS